MVRRKDTLIPDAVIEELHLLQTIHNMSLIDAVTYLRGNLVPAGYDAYPFRSKYPRELPGQAKVIGSNIPIQRAGGRVQGTRDRFQYIHVYT